MYQTLAMLLVVLPFALVPLAAVPVNGMVRAVLLSLRKKAMHGSVTPPTNRASATKPVALTCASHVFQSCSLRLRDAAVSVPGISGGMAPQAIRFVFRCTPLLQ